MKYLSISSSAWKFHFRKRHKGRTTIRQHAPLCCPWSSLCSVHNTLITFLAGCWVEPSPYLCCGNCHTLKGSHAGCEWGESKCKPDELSRRRTFLLGIAISQLGHVQKEPFCCRPLLIFPGTTPRQPTHPNDDTIIIVFCLAVRGRDQGTDWGWRWV